MKTVMAGIGPNEEREGRILNRIIAVSVEGCTDEAAQRHANLIVQELGLSDAKGVDAPGEDDRDNKE